MDIKINEDELEIVKRNNSFQRYDNLDLDTLSGKYGDYVSKKTQVIFPKI